MADEITPKSYFEEKIPDRLKTNPNVAKEINAIYEFVINGANGGTWTVDLTAPDGGKVTSGSTGNAKCTITVADNDFVGIITKKTNAQMAFMSGKLKIKGDMGLAMKLQKLLG
jgi:putative sterol carrier protein